jgi:ergothioneine biosynthesis protein EgtB
MRRTATTRARTSSPIDERFAHLLARYAQIRNATQALCTDLSAEDCVLQSMPDASPVKWHLAHTSWFFETFVLEQGLAGYRHFDPSFRFLYNSYYVGVGERHARPERGLISRPALDEVYAYRQHVDESIARWSQTIDPTAQAVDIFELGLHHEQQHQELILTDLKHLLSRNPLGPAYAAAPEVSDDGPCPLRWIAFPPGLRETGHAADGFSFDNERPRHRVYLNPFRIASRLVTNREYLAFIDDGGYARPQLWLSDGWDTRIAQQWTAPLYWQRDDGGRWRVFSLHGVRELDPDEPVCHVSCYEADAYARWAGARLATEAEWETAAAGLPVAGNFVESKRFHPATGGSGDGLQQMYGDVWEWTNSAYLGYPGYRPAAGAVGEYNGKFMVNQMVLRGGSCATPRSHIRATYRNFFYPWARWQFIGIRLAQDA